MYHGIQGLVCISGEEKEVNSLQLLLLFFVKWLNIPKAAGCWLIIGL